MALPSPEEEFFTDVKKEFLNFLWEGKPAKIKYDKLIQSYRASGLKVCDLKVKNNSLKSIWIKKLADPTVDTWWKTYALSVFLTKDSWLWECNMKAKYVTCFVLSKIGADIWAAWSQYNFKEKSFFKNQEELLDQVLWFNGNILNKKGIPFYSSKLAVGRCIYFHDIVNEDYSMLSAQEFHKKFQGRGSFLEYNSLIKAIPKVWRELLKAPVNHETHDDWGLGAILTTPKVSNLVYWAIIDNRNYTDARRIIWSTDIPECYSTQEAWEKIHIHINKITCCTKLRYFQYRLLNKYLITNIDRSKYDGSVSPLCSFCHLANETVRHLFFDCHEVHKFCQAFKRWSRTIIGVEMPDDFMMICLNKS